MTELDEANRTMSPKLMKNIGKTFPGSLIQAESGTQYKDDLTHLHHSARHQNKTRSHWQVQGLSEEGILTVREMPIAIYRRENRMREQRQSDRHLKYLGISQHNRGL